MDISLRFMINTGALDILQTDVEHQLDKKVNNHITVVNIMENTMKPVNR